MTDELMRDPETGRLLPGAKLPGAGRPKGSGKKDNEESIQETLDETIEGVDGRGRRRKRTKRSMAYMGAVNDVVVSKDVRKLRVLLDLEEKERDRKRAARAGDTEAATSERTLTENEKQVVQNLVERIRQSIAEESK